VSAIPNVTYGLSQKTDLQKLYVSLSGKCCYVSRFTALVAGYSSTFIGLEAHSIILDNTSSFRHACRTVVADTMNVPLHRNRPTVEKHVFESLFLDISRSLHSVWLKHVFEYWNAWNFYR